jgi:hypothetical protein
MPPKFKNFGIYFKCYDKKAPKRPIFVVVRGLGLIGERENIEGIDSHGHYVRVRTSKNNFRVLFSQAPLFKGT